jgi:hypothetical protein
MPELAAEPDAEMLGAEARRMIEIHDGQWDSLHAFATLHWKEGALSVGTWVAIDPGCDPAGYPAIMRNASFEAIQRDQENPPYAYALQIEAHVSEVPAKATAAEMASLAADLKAEKLHLRADARECVQAWVADIHGRLWFARKFRDGGEIEERHSPALAPQRDLMVAALVSVARVTPQRDLMVAALVSVARVTGLTAWGLEPTAAEQAAFDTVLDQARADR